MPLGGVVGMGLHGSHPHGSMRRGSPEVKEVRWRSSPEVKETGWKAALR